MNSSRLAPPGQKSKRVPCASTGRHFLSFPAPCCIQRVCHILRHSSRAKTVRGQNMASALWEISVRLSYMFFMVTFLFFYPGESTTIAQAAPADIKFEPSGL